MATITDKTYLSQPESELEGITLPALVRKILSPLASLKLTVALFAMAIFIIWVGTLAQAEKDMWDVIHDYFWTPVAFIEFQFLFPFQWLRGTVDLKWFSFTVQEIKIPLAYGFPFPGGMLIGGVMALNLLAAHLVRFKLQGKGWELVWGSLIALVGVGLTVLVIVSGHNSEGLQVDPPFAWTTLWLLIKGGSVACWLGLAYLLMRVDHTSQKVLSWILIIATVLTGALIASLFTVLRGFYPGDPALRVMWQLTQGGLAGIVILIGCLFLFRKRAGIVVIHLAVGLLLIGESFVSYFNVEEQMSIVEGEAVNFARDIRVTELAVIDSVDEDTQRHTVVPEHLLTGGDVIMHEELPFDIEVVEYYKNSELATLKPGDETPATAGFGLRTKVLERDPAAGADANSEVDFASAYVRLTDKQSGKGLGTFLVSQLFTIRDIFEKVTVGGTTYELGLRFKRSYKPYTILLKDVQKNDYIGTDTPKDYRSKITLSDPSKGIRRSEEIWMNNPLRYAGETFYQSGYNAPAQPGGPESTNLALVTNTGWMIPYVACMMALVGMAYHFSLTLVRFTNRVSRERRRESLSLGGWLGIGGAALFATIVMGYSLMPPRDAGLEMDLYGFGELPVVYKGRTKPLDTLARNSLQIISDRQSFEDPEGEKQPAILWLLDVMARPEKAEEYEVFRIRNHDVQQLLELQRKKGDRFSVKQITKTFEQGGEGDSTEPSKAEAFQRQVEQAEKARKDDAALSAYQSGLLDLAEKLQLYQILIHSLRAQSIPSPLEVQKNPAALDVVVKEQLLPLTEELPRRRMYLKQSQAPLAVPNLETAEWEPYSVLWDQAQFNEWLAFIDPSRELPETPPAAEAFNAVLAAYAKGNVKQFNQSLAGYQAMLADAEMPGYSTRKVHFESYFNHAQPFMWSMIIYLLAFVVAAAGLLVYHRELNWAAYAMIVVALVLHTLAIAARIYISGRPPVTNLYSSAVFIGWALVVFCLIVEAIYRSGIVNLLATIAGVSTLIVAMLLGADGDTFTVLQAVLDTQFWLTTHVICITLGYATTFVAGLFGVAYLVGRLVSPEFIAEKGKDITRMCYGAVCFAIFFSFLGTVLGGLWADDSWGRFWGWDPKENGALIIVLWNALILHARWGGMVKDRGLATLAVAGNIVTSWSWFGVNQLGIGLHSYGFTSGVVLSLTLFVISQLIIMATAAIPPRPIKAMLVGR